MDDYQAEPDRIAWYLTGHSKANDAGRTVLSCSTKGALSTIRRHQGLVKSYVYPSAFNILEVRVLDGLQTNLQVCVLVYVSIALQDYCMQSLLLLVKRLPSLTLACNSYSVLFGAGNVYSSHFQSTSSFEQVFLDRFPARIR